MCLVQEADIQIHPFALTSTLTFNTTPTLFSKKLFKILHKYDCVQHYGSYIFSDYRIYSTPRHFSHCFLRDQLTPEYRPWTKQLIDSNPKCRLSLKIDL
jgi:hypothetical protein